MTPPPERDQLFISYSHADRDWVDRLQKMITPLVRSEALRLWDDSRIPPGAKWKAEIEKALASAKVALLLVSDDFLASEFVTNKELPPLLRAAEEEGLCILWVCLTPCFYEATPIHEYQAVLPPGELLDAMSPVQQKGALKTIAGAIRDALRSEVAPAQVPPAQAQPAQVQTRPVPAPLPSSPAAPAAMDSSRLQRFPTSTCLLRQEGGRWSMERRSLQVEGYQQDLGEGVALTMVTIPAGSFLMGSPEDEPERSDDEGPQHKVTLGAFFMAQTPITQAQWRAVAAWQKVRRDLKPDPSTFKGANRPVEQVSWLDALEFCRRLNQRTGQLYGLPSEAQWEYACRAGSTTPFHFGATQTPELANYNGNHVYGNGPKGTYREQTIDVASFPANGWGLHDMHGNVLEWCEDHWYDSYNFAPGDDQPWFIPGAAADEPRLLRGGSWISDPGRCRSAYRNRVVPGGADDDVGFRVVCLPQDPSLNP
ncbi:SUMF1/EgtB/PvdO family nonheme iron enzyme [Synechococcus sp. Tobar12-5m-g]|uniref:SUMF1/EgtB/PvdO family nonheme iron enzyme n=1 Tax=unclassified Synechococcus TaxID=2626047 RepID=UPI0020CDCDDF|nr:MULTISPECIES: SUMF1/EgtB/PvdO family nonheme iron enzyme [unclassified Synechococcus]MCP9772456.1 SUMF1/EgtB/PvdO family nonheme iron enzyme [Synechococcus sp. Tobar12-5m-g]MCP9874284.1 SUMF1/EgtB/PvdO family nonheme iron enzyme [Synechococcus sp. Cruz CV-v-12]